MKARVAEISLKADAAFARAEDRAARREEALLKFVLPPDAPRPYRQMFEQAQREIEEILAEVKRSRAALQSLPRGAAPPSARGRASKRAADVGALLQALDGCLQDLVTARKQAESDVHQDQHRAEMAVHARDDSLARAALHRKKESAERLAELIREEKKHAAIAQELRLAALELHLVEPEDPSP